MTAERADCHIHMLLDGVWWKDAIAAHADGVNETLVRQRLERYRELGYTYLRDGGDRWGVGELAAKLAPEYGICYRTPCFPIYKNGHYGSFIGRGFETRAKYRALIAEVRSRGGHFIKLMISGLMDFTRYGFLTEEPLEAETIRWMAEIAHEAGFAVMAHANGDGAVQAALEAGIDSVEHGAYLTEETLCKLAESDTVWVPTLATVGNLVHEGRFPDATVEPLLAYQTRAVAFAAGRGAKIACGSDAGAYAVPHGQGGLDETAWLRRALDGKTDEILNSGLDIIREKF